MHQKHSRKPVAPKLRVSSLLTVALGTPVKVLLCAAHRVELVVLVCTQPDQVLAIVQRTFRNETAPSAIRFNNTALKTSRGYHTLFIFVD